MANEANNMCFLTKEVFPEYRSEPARFTTWFLRITVVLFGFWLVVFFCGMPVTFYIEGSIPGRKIALFSVCYYPVILWLIYRSMRYVLTIRKKAVAHIRINKDGIFYDKIDGSVTGIRYQDLGPSSDPRRTDDMFTWRHSGRTSVWVCVHGNEQAINFQTDAIHSYYARNTSELRNYFIYGVSIFRPDIRMSPDIKIYLSDVLNSTKSANYSGLITFGLIAVICLVILCIPFWTA